MRIPYTEIILSENPSEHTFIVKAQYADGKILVACLPKNLLEKARIMLNDIDDQDWEGSEKIIDWLEFLGIKYNKSRKGTGRKSWITRRAHTNGQNNT